MLLSSSKSVVLGCVCLLGVVAGCASTGTKLATSVPVAAITVPITTPITTAPESTTTTAAAAPAVFRPGAVGHAIAEPPPNPGSGTTVLGPGGGDLASVGYVQEEFFVSGTASAYESATALSADGRWSASPIYPQSYTTRIVVRRPIHPSAFTGNVAVEWLNVTAGFDAAPDWTNTHVELIRSGWVWVGVSAQAVGIVGSKRSIVASLALKNADPVRYAPLIHPGDDYSYDIFSQVGALLRTQSRQVLGGLQPQHVLAIGESQSAFRLTTYVNAIAPIANVYDGFLIHSRGVQGAPLFHTPFRTIAAPKPTVIRADVGAPVLMFETETDLASPWLDYQAARQPDAPLIRTWEVAGTAHQDLYGLGIGDTDLGSGAADATLFAAMMSPPDAIYGGVITCKAGINTGPHPYVLRSAVAALAAWIASGTPPTSTSRIEVDSSAKFTVDADGNVLGGVRTPQVDVPVATLSGLGQTGDRFCGLFGTTTGFDAATIATKYPSHDAFVTKWNASVDSAVSSGALLPADAAQLKTVAAASTIGAP